MAPINVTTSKQQITASVAEDKISANVSAGFGAVGPSGVVNVTAPITNSGTTTSANVGLSIGSGLSVSSGSLIVTPNTYATLVDGKIPAGQLPSYVDDVVEVATFGSLPSPGEQGKIYLVTQTNKVYRWTGFVWLEIVASPGSTDSIAEGSVNLYYTNTRAAAAAPVQSVAGRTGAVVLGATDIVSGTLSSSRLPIASAGSLGGVRIGSGISIDGSGVISASSGYTLPTASSNTLGGVKIGSGITITDGVISVSTNYAAASHTHAISDITDLATTLSGKADSSSLAAVAISGDYADLSNLPSIPDADQALKTTDEVRFGGVKLGDNVFRFRIETGPDALFLEKYNGTTFANWVSFADSGIRFPDGTTQASAFDGAYTSLTSVPSTFAPSAHKTSHATGGSDALSPSDIGAASASHAHSASDVTSGTFDIARIPTGTSSTTVSLGNHTHSQLHDRSHAITSSSDHTATAWRLFYSNGSGVITELTLGSSGTVLTSAGASAAPTFSALPAGGTKTIIRFTPADNQPPATNFATLDTRNSILVLEFDAATDESAVFVGYIPEGATLTNGLKVRLSWMADTATSGNVRWGVQFEAGGTDLDADSFATAALVTSAANGTSGIETVAEITATAIDSLAAGDRFRLRVYRDADDATNDTMTGDAQLVAVEVQVA